MIEPAFVLNALLSVTHVGIGLALLYTMHRRGYEGLGWLLWATASFGAFLRPLSLYFPIAGKATELGGVCGFLLVLIFLPGAVREATLTQTEGRALVNKIKDLTQRLAKALARIEVHKAFEKGLPIAAATFTRPTHDGGGMHLIWGSTPWLPFHKHYMEIEEAVGRSHYEMNPEVDQNEAFRQVHVRVSQTGKPEGDGDDFFSGKPLAWAAWGGPDGGVSMAAIRVEGGGPPEQRSPNEIRAHYRAVEEMLTRLEEHHVQQL